MIMYLCYTCNINAQADSDQETWQKKNPTIAPKSPIKLFMQIVRLLLLFSPHTVRVNFNLFTINTIITRPQTGIFACIRISNSSRKEAAEAPVEDDTKPMIIVRDQLMVISGRIRRKHMGNLVSFPFDIYRSYKLLDGCIHKIHRSVRFY